jgi:TPR repeat protein
MRGKFWKLGVWVSVVIAAWSLCVEEATAGRVRISELRKRAEAGEALAQADLGWRYYKGKGVRRDDVAAVHWMRLAAEQEVANAQFNMGFFLTAGVAGKPTIADFEQAIVWYGRAESNSLERARGERVKAILNLGYELETGRRFPVDLERAAVLYQEAAEAGNATAQINLGLLLQSGKGVERDLEGAARWLRAAEEQGEAKARDALAALEVIESLERAGLTAVALPDAPTRSVREKAEAGDAASQFQLAMMLRGGNGVDQSESESLRWVTAAAENGHAMAQAELAVMHHAGESVPQDYVRAAAWYRKAAEQGNSLAQSSLGAMYVNGEGIERDMLEGLKWIYISYAREHMSRYLIFRMERDLDETTFAEGRRLADAWFVEHDLEPTRYGPKNRLKPI